MGHDQPIRSLVEIVLSSSKVFGSIVSPSSEVFDIIISCLKILECLLYTFIMLVQIRSGVVILKLRLVLSYLGVVYVKGCLFKIIVGML